MLLLTWLLQWNSPIACCFQISGMALSGDQHKNERSKWSTFAQDLSNNENTKRGKKKKEKQTNLI